MANFPNWACWDELATQRGHSDTVFTVVGYGLNDIKPEEISLRIRYKALSNLVSLRSAMTDGYNLQTSNKPRSVGRWGWDQRRDLLWRFGRSRFLWRL